MKECLFLDLLFWAPFFRKCSTSGRGNYQNIDKEHNTHILSYSLGSHKEETTKIILGSSFDPMPYSLPPVTRRSPIHETNVSNWHYDTHVNL